MQETFQITDQMFKRSLLTKNSPLEFTVKFEPWIPFLLEKKFFTRGSFVLYWEVYSEPKQIFEYPNIHSKSMFVS